MTPKIGKKNSNVAGNIYILFIYKISNYTYYFILQILKKNFFFSYLIQIKLLNQFYKKKILKVQEN